MSSITKIKAVLQIMKPRPLWGLLSVGAAGYLRESGWMRSFAQRSSVDLQGNPLPWVTLPFIDFVAGRLHPTMNVFEFGCGKSTLFYSARVGRLHSVEHDKAWYLRMQSQARSNTDIQYIELVRDGEYCRAASRKGMAYDLIVIDGRDRVNCTVQSVSSLSEGGCVVLDDSERSEYRDAVRHLQDLGFRSLDFWGLAPGVANRKCTTVFYRDGNCLGI